MLNKLLTFKHFIVLLTTIVTFLGSVSAADNTIDRIKKSGKLRVAQVNVEQPPFFYHQPGTGKWVGFEIDLAQTIADRLGVSLEWVRMGDDYNEVCWNVADGKADLGISNLSDNAKRRERVDFSIPYIVSRVAMVVDLESLEKSGIDAIEPADLNRPEVKIVITEESAYEFAVDEMMPKATKVYTKQGTFEDLMQALLDGKGHALVDDGLTLNLGTRIHPDMFKARFYLHIFGDLDDPLSICLPKNEPDFLVFINSIINEIEDVDPPTLEFLMEKYMGVK